MSSNHAVLLNQISRLGPLDRDLLAAVADEVRAITTGWAVNYGDYQSGGWYTLSLINPSGQSEDVTIHDGHGVPTEILEGMPNTKALLASLPLDIMWVRLARLEAGAYLWEHRDYGELSEVDHFRLHVPLVTNPSAVLAIDGHTINMQVGDLWRLAPVFRHGVCNVTGPERIHIVIDCYETEELSKILAAGHLLPDDVKPLPPLEPMALKQELAIASELLAGGFAEQAEEHLLKLFFRFDTDDAQGYHLITQMYAQAGDAKKADEWRERRAVLMGEGVG
ncbi:aspartyl/asparaginyl beta-hydroxylase domain-containing protein [Micromonospora sp. WMMD964]|uniref:aspartyl/asparaginyl beta-hydroxylase domain-containing protein n=1 Tax=Micromonospora sp. WMMD964 TaxID=3016091 RepID=UPI00249A918E|nr:aspartyl/asparaginyl beta-hydroxylase domain-containing protein [Micromonospora sp. WMMD964]WFE98629.1 aspartyl/asparaginyl beta-hydroxylase domain-containing protein [Micromonospora sp. WMMD964]